MDRGALWATVSGVAQSRTRLKRLSSSSSSFYGVLAVEPAGAVPGTWTALGGQDKMLALSG